MILNRQRTVPVARRPLELFLRRVRDTLGFGEADLTICLVSDAEIARMNEAFRKKKGPTDVLSFRFREQGMGKRASSLRKRVRTQRPGASRDHHSQPAEPLGDVAISPATALRNAKRYGRTLSAELRILILHGALHLLGYDHETDHGQMNRVERRLRKRLGLA